MGVLIVVLGVIGIAVALAAVVESVITTVRTRRILDVVLVLGSATVAVWLLIAYGDVIMQ